MSMSMTGERRRAQKAWNGRLAIAAGLAVGCAVVMAGCDDDSPTGAALDRASVQLREMTPAGAAPASLTIRQQVYQQVGSDLSGATNQGTPAENAAASILLAETKIGQGQIAAARATELEAQALRLARRLRAALSDWAVRSARAEAAAQYDPAPELADIESQISERREQIEQARGQKAEVEAKVADLRAQAQAKLDEAEGYRREEGLLRQRSLEAKATEGAKLLEQATEQKRRADAVEVQAGNLEASAALIEPQIGEIDLEIARIEKQIELLESARQEVNARAQAARSNAQDAREAAAAAAQDADQLLAELAALRTGDLAQSLEEAIRHFEGAARDAKNAASASRTTANVVAGTAQQQLGGVQRLRARSWTDHATILEALAAASPAMPNAQTYAAAAQEARAQAQAALEASNAAYADAQSAYGSAGAKGEAQERLQALSNRLGQLAGVPLDEEVAPSGDGEPSDEPASDASGAASAGGPQSVMDAMLDAVRQGQYSQIAEHVYIANPANQQALEAVVTIAEAFGRVDQAMQSQYGKGLMQAGMEQAAAMGGQAPGLPSGTDPRAMLDEMTGGLATASSSEFEWQVDGDIATATHRDDPTNPVQMRLVDGRWLFDLTPYEGMLDAQPQADQYRELIAFAAPLITDALNQAAAEIEAGQYGSTEVAVNAVNLKLQPLLMQIMGKMQELGIQMPMGPGGLGGG